jgi:hypothetical protein
MADPSIRATLTQSEEGVWRFSWITCLIDAGAALEKAAMAATTTILSANILGCRVGDAAVKEGGVQSSFYGGRSQLPPSAWMELRFSRNVGSMMPWCWKYAWKARF